MTRTTHTCRSLECWMSHDDLCLRARLPLDMGKCCAAPLRHKGRHSYTLRMAPKINVRSAAFVRPCLVGLLLSLPVGLLAAEVLS